MILVAGLTPAWQQVMCFDRLASGEVNRASEVSWCASGKVLNVAICLAHLGAQAAAVAPLGREVRDPIDREFAALGIDRHWIDVEGRTRVCTTLVERDSGRVTELVENAEPLARHELEQFADVLARRASDARLAVLTGSLPAGAPVSLYRDLKVPASCQTILDVSGPELLAALDTRPLVVKPNRSELARTVGRALESDEQLHEAMRELNDRGAQWVVISDGPSCVWLRSGGRLYRCDVPQVCVVNPIGSGDCLAAGLAWGLAQGLDMTAAAGLGIAAAVDNVQRLLPARSDQGQVRYWAESIAVRTV